MRRFTPLARTVLLIAVCLVPLAAFIRPATGQVGSPEERLARVDA
ncbi:MAG: hypothetical protein AB1758_36875 [Candidatus Eremiobacterota bacterium]